MAKLPSFRLLLKQVLHLQESPQRTALAFAIGVFIGFSPLYGLHTLMVFFCSWALRLNLLALMAGAFLNNPWTVVPILGATYWVGAFLLGGLVLSLLGAALAYPLAYFFVAKYRESHPLATTEPLPPPQDVR